MKLRTRALLIIFGIVIFAVAAPLAIFFATGVRYNFDKNTFEKTGAVLMKTEPRAATVFLDNERNKATPLTKRFLLPKDYDLKLTKESYQAWEKRITVLPGLVTDPSPLHPEKIFLLLENPDITTITTSTLSFSESDSEIYYLTKTVNDSGPLFQINRVNKVSNRTELVAEQNNVFINPQIIEVINEELIIKDQGAYWHFAGDRLTPLPSHLSRVKLGNKPETVLGITLQQSLVMYEPKTGIETEIITDTAINAFSAQAGDVYFIEQTAQGSKLKRLSGNQAEQTLITDVPDFESGQIIISPSKEIFLLLDQTLYQVTETLKKLNANIRYAHWNKNSEVLLYGNNNEAWMYLPMENQPNLLITRSSAPLGKPVYNKKTGYLFIQSGNELRAIEVTDNNQPLSFRLTEISSLNSPIAINQDGNTIIYQDGSTIYSLKIR